jgi:hypothetical protein
MYDYARTKKADHPGDVSFNDFSIGYARAFGTHLMEGLTAETGLKWWFDKLQGARGRFNVAFKFLPGGGQRLEMFVNLTITPDAIHISMTLPYGGKANFNESPEEKPSAIAATVAHRLKDSFAGE